MKLDSPPRPLVPSFPFLFFKVVWSDCLPSWEYFPEPCCVLVKPLQYFSVRQKLGSRVRSSEPFCVLPGSFQSLSLSLIETPQINPLPLSFGMSVRSRTVNRFTIKQDSQVLNIDFSYFLFTFSLCALSKESICWCGHATLQRSLLSLTIPWFREVWLQLLCRPVAHTDPWVPARGVCPTVCQGTCLLGCAEISGFLCREEHPGCFGKENLYSVLSVLLQESKIGVQSLLSWCTDILMHS